MSDASISVNEAPTAPTAMNAPTATNASSVSGLGPLFVALAAILWATDALFRYPVMGELTGELVVLIEHLIAVALLLPFLLLRDRRLKNPFTLREWAGIALIGAGGSAAATTLFSESFKYVNPSVAILLQKIQPVLVVLIAFLTLGERPRRSFYPWAAIALVAAIELSLPDFKFNGSSAELYSKGAFFALAAAFLWAGSTVAGRALLTHVEPITVTFWRFFFGLLALAAYSLVVKTPIPWETLSQPSAWQGLAYISILPGLLAMVAYYYGLARTTASVTTFVELIFPVSAVLLNTWLLHLPLSGIQLAAGSVLVAAVVRLSISK